MERDAERRTPSGVCLSSTVSTKPDAPRDRYPPASRQVALFRPYRDPKSSVSGRSRRSKRASQYRLRHTLSPPTTPTAGGPGSETRSPDRPSIPLGPSPLDRPPPPQSVAGHAPFPRDEVRRSISEVLRGRTKRAPPPPTSVTLQNPRHPGRRSRPGTQGRPHCAGPWVPALRCAAAGMTRTRWPGADLHPRSDERSRLRKSRRGPPTNPSRRDSRAESPIARVTRWSILETIIKPFTPSLTVPGAEES